MQVSILILLSKEWEAGKQLVLLMLSYAKDKTVKKILGKIIRDAYLRYEVL